jgi:hypothetical protein
MTVDQPGRYELTNEIAITLLRWKNKVRHRFESLDETAPNNECPQTGK